MSDEIVVTKVEQLPEYNVGGSGIKVSAAKLEELGKDLRRRFETIRLSQDRGRWESMKAESLAAYLMMPPDKPLPYEGYPNLRSPLTRIGVDSFHANLMYSIFGQSNQAKIKPHYVSRNFISVANKGAQFLTYQLNYEAGFFEAIDDADNNAEKYGNGYLEPHYVKEYKWETRKVTHEETDPTTGKVTSKTRTEKVKVPMFDGIKIESIDPSLVYRSPFIQTIEAAVKLDVVFKLSRKKLRELKLGTKPYDKDDEPFYIPGQVDQLVGKRLNQLLNDKSRLQTVLRAYDGFTMDYVINEEAVDLVQAHLWDDIDNDGIPENITVVFDADSGIVVRITLASCRIVEIKPRPIQGRAEGESIYSLGRSINIEWEARHNGISARNDWATLPWGLYQAGGRFDPQAIQLMPGKMYPVDDVNGVAFPQMASASMPAYQDEQLLLTYWERMTGLTENIQGIAAKGDTSATETIQISQKSGIRLATPLSRIVGAIEDLLGHMWDLNRECAPDDKEFYIVGAGKGVSLFDKIARKDFGVQMQFKLNVSTVFDQQLMRDTMLLAYKTFSINPLIQNNPATFYQLTRTSLDALNVELDIPKPPQSDALSPMEEHELMFKGERVDPVVGEDYDDHLKTHKAFLQTEEFEDWPDPAKRELIIHIDETSVLKKMLEASNLNKSGVFEGMPGGAPPPTPGMTASQNPSDTMNRLRVGPTGPTMRQNTKNAFPDIVKPNGVTQ